MSYQIEVILLNHLIDKDREFVWKIFEDGKPVAASIGSVFSSAEEAYQDALDTIEGAYKGLVLKER